MARKPYPFYQLTYDHLQHRLDDPSKRTYTDLRNLFYQLREQFFRETGKTKLRKVKDIYSNWEFMANRWIKQKAEELYGDENLWVRLRDELNIQARGRALCYTAHGDEYLVTKKRRSSVENDCSFILICEKLKVGMDVFNSLTKLGYKVNYISTGGYAPGDVQDAILLAFPEEVNGFYIIVLHDYDTHGVEILANLHKLSDKVLDVGINEAFMEYNKIDHSRVDEPFTTKRENHEVLTNYVNNCATPTNYDLEYLTESGRRVEIDVVDVRYGSEPFIKYIQHVIETDCPEWDLGRIYGELELDEPDNPFEGIIGDFKGKVVDEYYKKQEELLANRKKIMDVVELETTMGSELYSLITKNIPKKWPNHPDREHPYLKELEEKYSYHINKSYLEDYDEDTIWLLSKFHHYEGDVREGMDEINRLRDELQKTIDSAAIDDPSLDALADDLDAADYGQEQLSRIEPEPLDIQIMNVIDALYEMLEDM